MSTPGLPSVAVRCGLGNASTGTPSSIGWGGPQMPFTLSTSGPRVPGQFTSLLSPFRFFLWLLFVLLPGFIVVVGERNREKWVYIILSRPDIYRWVHRYFETQHSLWKTETHNLQNLCVSSGMASWEQRAIENGKSETADVSRQNVINCQVNDMGKKHWGLTGRKDQCVP